MQRERAVLPPNGAVGPNECEGWPGLSRVDEAAAARVRSVVLTKLVAALGAVVKDGGTFVCRTALECVEVHLLVSASRTLFLDGGLLWLLVVA